MDAPKLIVVGGPNGSGKTTFAIRHADETGFRYIGADAIAAKLSPDDFSAAKIPAARQFVSDIGECLENRQSIIVESTLAGRSLAKAIANAKELGYEITVVFMYLESGNTCIDRVAQRVKLGGHDVPDVDIRRRFKRSIRNFWQIYRTLADFWVLVYNAGQTPENVAFGDSLNCIVRIDELFELYQSIRDSND